MQSFTRAPQQGVIEQVEKIYMLLERMSLNEARLFSNQDQASLREARTELQRIRLWLYDITGTKPSGQSQDDVNGFDLGVLMKRFLIDELIMTNETRECA